jgi:small conductance mechanosensitive channel
MRAEDEWSPVFLGDPDLQGVESMTREETVIRMVARVRPGEQFRVARELRRRIRERLDRLDIGTHEPTASTPPANTPAEDATPANAAD